MKKIIRYLKRVFRYIYTKKINFIFKNSVINPDELTDFNYKNILIFSPHYDDEIIGCGGLLLKLKKADSNCKIYLYSFNSKDVIRNQEAQTLAEKAGFILIDDWSFVINSIDLILIPSPIENHKDHIKMYLMLSNKLRKMKFNIDVYLYNVWAYSFPNIVIDISDVIDEKLSLLSIYKSQLDSKDYLHIAKGLNAYYSLYLNNPDIKPSYAEVFFKTTSQKFILLYM